MGVSWTRELTEQLAWYWTTLFRPRLAGLTDEEYFWEPVTGCWSIRPTARGRLMLDLEYPEPSPPPVTTIAWRMAHIAGPVLGIRASNHFGAAEGPFRDLPMATLVLHINREVFHHAAEVALLRDLYRARWT
jgi:hypothetical protein